MSFFDELKRRNVIKATMAYVVIAWVLIQVLSIVLPIFQAPTWFLKAIMILLIIGLPIWMVFSWVYDVTPDGLKKTSQIEKDDSITATTNKRLNIIILIVLLIAIAVNFIDKPDAQNEAISSTTDLPRENSIAVLPFLDVSPNKEDEFYSDGMAVAILNDLCKFKKLMVVGQTSSFSFKNKDEDIKSIGEQLNADHILEGTVQRQQGNIMISVRLTDSKSGYTIFSESYSDKLDNIFDLQSKIAMDIAKKIGSEFALGDNKLHIRKKIDPLAYETFLKGQSVFVNGPLNMQKSELIEAKKYFEQAVKLDSNFAEANAYLSLVYFNLADWVLKRDLSSKRNMALDSAKLLAKRSHALDSLSSGAHLAMGSYYFHEYNWIQAEIEKRKAVALNPGGAQEKFILAMFLAQFGQAEEALELDREAMKLDPLFQAGAMNYIWALYFANKFDEAIMQCNLLIEENRASGGIYQCLTSCYVAKKSYEKARLSWVTFSEMIKENEMAEFFRENDFKTAVKKTLAYDKEHPIELLETLVYKASFYAMIEDKDNTIKYLNEAFKQMEPDISLMRHSRFDFIKNDPRYLKLYKKVGFKDYDEKNDVNLNNKPEKA